MFESLDLPVLFEAEVVVAGGGPAGIAAALAAARLGKRVVLLEQTGRVSVVVKGKTVRIFINH